MGKKKKQPSPEGIPGIPVTEEDEALWEKKNAEQLKGIERIEGTAKYLTTLIGAVTGLAVTGGKVTGIIPGPGESALFYLGLGFFCFSLVVSLFVHMPLPWKYDPRKPGDLFRVYGRLSWLKWWFMMGSVVLFCAGCAVMGMLAI